MQQASTSFQAFALKFTLIAACTGLLVIAAVSASLNLTDSGRQEWVRNIPVAGTNFSFQ